MGASSVEVSHDDLIGVIRVAPGEGRRLVNIGKRLSAGDQVNVRAAVEPVVKTVFG